MMAFIDSWAPQWLDDSSCPANWKKNPENAMQIWSHAEHRLGW